MLADAWLRAVNASGLGSSPVSYTAFFSVQWALNPDGCQTTYNRTFQTYTPLAAPRPAQNHTQCCGFCKVCGTVVMLQHHPHDTHSGQRRVLRVVVLCAKQYLRAGAASLCVQPQRRGRRQHRLCGQHSRPGGGTLPRGAWAVVPRPAGPRKRGQHHAGKRHQHIPAHLHHWWSQRIGVWWSMHVETLGQSVGCHWLRGSQHMPILCSSSSHQCHSLHR